MIPGYGITGTWSLGAIPIERRCSACDERMGLKETSPCEKCTPRKQRGATRSQLAYRAKLVGVCPDCGLRKSVCRELGGCQPEPVSRGQMLASVLKVIP